MLHGKSVLRVFKCVYGQQPARGRTSRPNSFITTPIFYVNGDPHIGHLYSALLGDVLYRWQLINQPDAPVVFTGGTDEHGIKIQRGAEKRAMDPRKFCDENSAQFRRMFDKFGVSATHFTRTTDQKHIDAVHHFWETLQKRGFITKSAYCGWYSVTDEAFYGDAEVKPSDSDPSVKVASCTGSPVQWIQEDNYMFSTSRVHSQLRKWLTDGAEEDEEIDETKGVVKPSLYLPQVLAQVKDQEISLSRDSSRVSWGIPVPGDDSQTIYVWFDALVNYLTAIGYPDGKAVSSKWPPNTQIVGKEIIRFHAVLWPALLIAADLPLPDRLSIHGHWTSQGRKMSKSIGNVVDPFEEAELLGVDGLRYYLLRQGVTHEDANYERNRAVRICNAELANNLGNLLQRTSMDD